MLGGRLVIPGTITNTALPLVTENAEYDTIANLPGLFHFLDWASSKVLASNPLSVADHVADIAYTRRSGYAGNPTIVTVGSGQAVSFPATSEIVGAQTIDMAADWSVAFVMERDASSSTATNCTLWALSPVAENAQFFAAATTNAFSFFGSSPRTWTNSLSGSLAPGEKAVLVFAYDAATRTMRAWKNGVSIGSATVAVALTPDFLYFGRSALLRLGHVFVFNVDLNESTHAATRSYVTSYLTAKHGI